jgi:hypothetical protein
MKMRKYHDHLNFDKSRAKTTRKTLEGRISVRELCPRGDARYEKDVD